MITFHKIFAPKKLHANAFQTAAATAENIFVLFGLVADSPMNKQLDQHVFINIQQCAHEHALLCQLNIKCFALFSLNI